LIYQKFLEQHPDLSALHPSSINSVRIDTSIIDNEVTTSAAVLRIGTGNSVVDNASAKGFCVGVDLATGRLKDKGYRKPHFGGGPIFQHPDTGLVLADMQLPFWPELLDLINRAARAFEPFGTLGWDIAFTPDGPVLIEANVWWVVTTSELGSGGIADTPFGRYAVANFVPGAA
jgi:hypothetical protein